MRPPESSCARAESSPKVTIASTIPTRSNRPRGSRHGSKATRTPSDACRSPAWVGSRAWVRSPGWGPESLASLAATPPGASAASSQDLRRASEGEHGHSPAFLKGEKLSFDASFRRRGCQELLHLRLAVGSSPALSVGAPRPKFQVTVRKLGHPKGGRFLSLPATVIFQSSVLCRQLLNALEPRRRRRGSGCSSTRCYVFSRSPHIYKTYSVCYTWFTTTL